jgi:hypothetical protein
MEPDPRGSFRWLGDEVEDDTDDREQTASELGIQLAECERFLRLFAFPDWSVMEEHLSQEALTAQAALASATAAPTLVHVAAYRARLGLARHLLDMPKAVAEKQHQLSEQLERIDRTEEDEREEET